MVVLLLCGMNNSCCLVAGCRRTRYQQWFRSFRPVTSAESLVLRQVMPRYGLSRERCPKTSQKYAERQRERETSVLGGAGLQR